MGIFSGIFGKKEEAPPEPLVFGARLHCMYGSQDSYLVVDSDNISINNLPKAGVEDSKTPENIQPFGTCLQMDVPCKSVISLDDKWTNVEPQNTRVNGKEIITTKSTITCNFAGMLIKAKTSGQDKVYINELLFAAEMEGKYKALNEILQDPYGSFYLNEGMHELALQFLEDRMKKQGGSIQLTSLYSGEVTLENSYIRDVLGRLLPGCDAQNPSEFTSDLINVATMYGMDTASGWNSDYLNPAMLDLIRKDSSASAERIKNDDLFRATEAKKREIHILNKGTDLMAYVAVGLASLGGGSSKKAGKENAKPDAKKVDEGGSGAGATEYKTPSGGGGISNNIKIGGKEITFGHGGRHLEGTGLSTSKVEQVIANEVGKVHPGTGQFYKGQVTLDGITIEFTSYGVKDSVVNIGTYYPK